MTPPSELREVVRADVYKAGDLAGALVRTQHGTRFSYDPRYTQADLPPIATSLPYGASGTEIRGGALPTFFTNLLPEGVRLLALKDRTHTSLDDEFTLLLAVGRDCVGDVAVVPEGEDPDELPQITTTDDIDALFARATAAEDPVALAGVQEKVSSAMYTSPVQSSRGPAIVKLGPPRLPQLVQNEHFFLRMAVACGLPSAKSHIIQDSKGHEALWVDRFDRERSGNGWKRLAQEDGCQLCDRYPASKYVVSVRELTEAYQAYASVPQVALLNLLTQLSFAYLIGNADLHAKNVSLGETRTGFMPTPAYDLVSTLPYAGLDQKMALKMDGRNDRFRRAHFHTFFGRYRIPAKAVDRTLDRMCDAAPAWIDRLPEIGFDDKITARVAREIQKRREDLGAKTS